MTRRPLRYPRLPVLGAIAAMVLALSLSIERRALSQMISSGVRNQPARPLPPGMKAPAVDFRDVAAEAGLSAVIVSGDDQDQSSVLESTGTGVAIFDYDNDGLPDIFL